MKITQLYVYPIKSLRPISLPSANLCPQGLEYDRRYILLKPLADGAYKNMFVGNAPEMALFHCESVSPSSFSVEYQKPDPPIAPQTPSQSTSIHIPFTPDCTDLQKVDISIHTLPSYGAHRMSDEINTWFTECFGYEVVLAYLGDALGFIKEGEKTQVWTSALKKSIPSKLSAVTFSDTAALLVCSEASLEDLHPRLEGEKAVLEKFRPNIVIDGVGIWDEDYWGELTISRSGLKIILTSNCTRCTSINVDLEKGRMGEGPSGALLKKMMKDRRIDAGNKWEPVFGRYGFPTSGGEIRVGDEVVVSVRNKEYSVDNGVLPRLATFEHLPSQAGVGSQLSQQLWGFFKGQA